jgi:Kdo2-lipid IVA lauroyltransferase/acyltransferase
MKKFYYPILALPIYLLVLLPFPVYYLLSDFFYFLGYYIIGYRKKVIAQNLKNSFPEKTDAELDAIGKRYFAHMVDLFFETFKLLVMSSREVKKRFVFTNLEVLDTFAANQQSIIVVAGHYGNWEWYGQSFQLSSKFQQDFLYHPLSNAFFDWLTYRLRVRFGGWLIPMNVSIKEMIKRKSILTATAFLTDQTPSNTDGSLWLPFLNQDTPVFLGSERIARKMNRPVVYAKIEKVKRGYYQTHFTVITDKPAECAENWITEEHTRLLEADIIANPDTWLWSHRRWKHKRK